MNMSRRNVLLSGVGLGLATAGLGRALPASARGPEDDVVGALYAETNAASGNVIRTILRTRDGRFVEGGQVATGRQGSGDGLGSQGAVVVTDRRDYLVAVNAGYGSAYVSAFKLGGDFRLTPHGSAYTNGVRPVSVTTFQRRFAPTWVWALNAGGPAATPSFQGMWLDSDGISPDPGWHRTLPNGSQPAQIGISPDGRWLVVTLKAANQIITQPLDEQGYPAGDYVVNESTGVTPFGFSFDPKGNLLVSNANGGTRGGSSVSSYAIGDDGRLDPRSGPIATGQTAACWLVASRDGRDVFVTNTGSSTVSRLQNSAGRLSLGAGIAARSGQGPVDAVFGRDGQALYVLNGAGQSVDAFDHDATTGAITFVATYGDLPAGMVGLAAA